MISVINYGMGNLRSVVKAFELYTDQVQVASSPEMLEGSSVVVLPGDGAFGMAMEHLTAGGWVEPIRRHIADGKIFVGICVGYQLLFETSEEFGSHTGLGIVPGAVKRFVSADLKVPHMGWNNVSFNRQNDFIDGVADNSHFYFIHTFYPEIADESWLCGTTEYGVPFASMIQKGNVFGTQFHPEKSHDAGLAIIRNIVKKASLLKEV